MAGTLRYLFADHLSRSVSSLKSLNRPNDVVLLTEVAAETDYVPHHPKKIAFLFSAMRHFARTLQNEGVTVDYVKLDDPGNSGSFEGELHRAVARHEPARIVVTHPGEYRVLRNVRGWSKALGLPVEIRDDDRFFSSLTEFEEGAAERKSLRMELFYRKMRKSTGLLMQGDEPVGGQWNFDVMNRKRLPKGMVTPTPQPFEPDELTSEVLRLVDARFGDRFGDTLPFTLAVTAEQADAALEHFVTTALARFGDYQDAMRQGDHWLFHSGLSAYLNAGLLLPRQVCLRVEQAYLAGQVPLNSAEGFIRQILGWREYVRGIYWLRMPGYAELNVLDAQRPLPAFYWTGDTDLNCLHQVIGQTRREALSHHIQRLMVTGNFALLAGVRPEEICIWYLSVYADAFEWVELPNTLGMAMYADGGYLGSKAYAASGAYIDRMSDFCGRCRYDVKQKTGPDACPFNYLYWDFIGRNRRHLGRNPRMIPIYRALDALPDARRREIRADAMQFLDGLEPWQRDY